MIWWCLFDAYCVRDRQEVYLNRILMGFLFKVITFTVIDTQNFVKIKKYVWRHVSLILLFLSNFF